MHVLQRLLRRRSLYSEVLAALSPTHLRKLPFALPNSGEVTHMTVHAIATSGIEGCSNTSLHLAATGSAHKPMAVA